MWYVVQVRTGLEASTLMRCQKSISRDVLEYGFIPTYEEKRKIRGEWRILRKLLFPSYIFMVSEDVEGLARALYGISGFTKLLGAGEYIIPLTEKEVQFLKDLGGEEANVPMSEGIIEGGRTKVLEGPLMGREGTIRKIDRHKRKAWIEVEMFGRLQLVEVGLEITAKS